MNTEPLSFFKRHEMDDEITAVHTTWKDLQKAHLEYTRALQRLHKKDPKQCPRQVLYSELSYARFRQHRHQQWLPKPTQNQ